MTSIESRVAITILEEPVGEITLEGKTYTIPAPTTATIIAVSALIADLPEFDLSVPDQELPAQVLKHGDAGETLAKIAATLMLGQKRINERHFVEVKTESKRHWSWLPFKSSGKQESQKLSEFDYLTRKIIDNCTPKQLREITFALIKEGGLDDFFILTTSLRAKNQIAPTKKEVEKATVYGHS